MKISQSMVGLCLAALLGIGGLSACGGGDPPDKTGRTDGPNTHGIVTTFAGNGTKGSNDGLGRIGSFASPYGIAIDSADTMYVADFLNEKIRKIAPDGMVSTFAGTGNPGSTNATGIAASFNRPKGIAVDSDGNVYVSDSGNNLIRKITSAGVVSTLAGLAGTSGSADGTGAAARFYDPRGLVVDSVGNVYVADGSNNLIRKITPAGGVTTVAGSSAVVGGFVDGTGTAARFNSPSGLTLDSGGNLYVVDSFNHRIRKITPAGDVSTFAGSGTPGKADGTGTAASFRNPGAIAVSSNGNFYVADTDNYLIRMITPAGEVTTVAGTGVQGDLDDTGTFASFKSAFGIAVDSKRNIFVADTFGDKIRKITP